MRSFASRAKGKVLLRRLLSGFPVSLIVLIEMMRQRLGNSLGDGAEVFQLQRTNRRDFVAAHGKQVECGHSSGRLDA